MNNYFIVITALLGLFFLLDFVCWIAEKISLHCEEVSRERREKRRLQTEKEDQNVKDVCKETGPETDSDL